MGDRCVSRVSEARARPLLSCSRVLRHEAYICFAQFIRLCSWLKLVYMYTRIPQVRPPSCYVNLQEKKKALPLSGISNRLTHFSLCTELSIGTPCQRSQASRLNHLLFEVTAIATPQVAYSFVTKRCPALHTFNRAGRGAGTRRETKSQLSRCSYLSENASIRAERFRNPSYPFGAWGS
jgi:hypothetical protein